MRTTLWFDSFEEYEKWTEQFENSSDYEGLPTVIDDGWKVAADMFTECKGWKTALRRIEKAFADVYKEVPAWVECIRESCENGCFEDTTCWMPEWTRWTRDPETIRELAKDGTYSYGVEEVMEGYWYVFLNISGCYAGRNVE